MAGTRRAARPRTWRAAAAAARVQAQPCARKETCAYHLKVIVLGEAVDACDAVHVLLRFITEVVKPRMDTWQPPQTAPFGPAGLGTSGRLGLGRLGP